MVDSGGITKNTNSNDVMILVLSYGQVYMIFEKKGNLPKVTFISSNVFIFNIWFVSDLSLSEINSTTYNLC